MDTVSLPFSTMVMQVLGLPGLFFIVWYFGEKRRDKEREEDRRNQEISRAQHAKDIADILGQYKEEVGSIKQLYTNNADLVKRYDRALERMEKLTTEMMSVVALNSQSHAHLADAIENNRFCPTVRNGGRP